MVTLKEKRGITLIELAFTMLISLSLVGTSVYYYNDAVESTKVSSLQQTLSETRKAIDAYYKINGSYPLRLTDLTTGPNMYLRSVPVDPVTGTSVWIIVGETGETTLSIMPYTGVYDIKSTSLKYGNL